MKWCEAGTVDKQRDWHDNNSGVEVLEDWKFIISLDGGWKSGQVSMWWGQKNVSSMIAKNYVYVAQY